MGESGMGHIAGDPPLDTTEIRQVRRLLGDHPGTVVSVCTADGRMLWASAVGSRALFGRDPAEFLGHNALDYIHPEDVAEVRRHFARAAAGETVRFTSRAMAADGLWHRTASVAWPTTQTDERAIVVITAPATTRTPA